MTHILVVVGSARKGRVADSVTKLIEADIAGRDGVEATVVDLAKLELPFYDNERAPSDPEYTPSHESVIAWGKKVAEADAVVFVTPEYNHNLSALQKNAIDSLFAEWNDKPATVVAYGWYGGTHSIAAIKELAPVIKIDLKDTLAELYFTKDIQPDGSVIDGDSVAAKIRAAINTIA